MPHGPDVLTASGLPPAFRVANGDAVGIRPPAIRSDRGDALTTWVRALSVMQKEAIVASARTGLVWRLSSDEGDYLDGHDAAPCPLAFFTVGTVASLMNEVTALADQRGIKVDGLKLVQDSYYTMEGSLPKGTMVGGALPVDLAVEIDTPASGDDVRQLAYDAVAASPANGLIRGQLTSRFALSLNGDPVATDRVAAVDRDIYPDPDDRFAAAEAAPPAADDPLILKGGMTPKVAGAGHTAGRGSSLTAEQKRVLRVGGECVVRADGIKEITQSLYSPHGSQFRFLSEEAPVNGGEGRAPDALSFISAGIGFCFMTQLGRYVAIMKKQLDDYRIVQDTHFSLGGASGGTGQAGAADAVETHLYLTSPEGEEFATHILDMGEQTCFLHALCRADTRTRVRVV